MNEQSKDLNELSLWMQMSKSILGFTKPAEVSSRNRFAGNKSFNGE
jgi:hypothetical protein